MSATALVDLVDDGGADVRGSDPDAVVELLSAMASAGPSQTWTLFFGEIGSNDRPNLAVGLAHGGTHGWLEWWDGRSGWVPEVATRTGDLVDYWCGPQHMQVDAGWQLPVGVVVAAVREFVVTGHRPGGVPWKHDTD